MVLNASARRTRKRTVPQWQAAYATEVHGPFEKGAASLKKQYLATLEKQLAALAQAAKLDDAGQWIFGADLQAEHARNRDRH